MATAPQTPPPGVRPPPSSPAHTHHRTCPHWQEHRCPHAAGVPVGQLLPTHIPNPFPSFLSFGFSVTLKLLIFQAQLHQHNAPHRAAHAPLHPRTAPRPKVTAGSIRSPEGSAGEGLGSRVSPCQRNQYSVLWGLWEELSDFLGLQRCWEAGLRRHGVVMVSAWREAHGGMLMEGGSWREAHRGRLMEGGSWRDLMEGGSWREAHGVGALCYGISRHTPATQAEVSDNLQTFTLRKLTS